MMTKPFSPKWFEKKLRQVIAQAGPRYTPELNVDLPIKDIFSALAHTRSFIETAHKLCDSCKKISANFQFWTEIENLRFGVRRDLELQQRKLQRAAALLKKCRRFEPTDFQRVGKNVSAAIRSLASIDEKIRAALEQERKSRESRKETKRTDSEEQLDGLLRRVMDTLRELSKVSDFCHDDKAAVANRPALLVLGIAGAGKTHLLCDLASERIAREEPTVVVLAQQLQLFRDPWEAIIQLLGLNLSKEAFFTRLAAPARHRRTRTLILIDALNESDRASWRKKFRDFLGAVKPYPEIGIAVTCRLHFEKTTLPKRAPVTTVLHQGFAEHELEAMVKYFERYRIPLPEVPPLVPEFSNPFFLKLFCQTLERAVHKKKHNQVKQISEGLTGMLNIFEDFIVSRGKSIERAFGLPRKTIWITVKEEIANIMANSGRGWVARQELQMCLRAPIKMTFTR